MFLLWRLFDLFKKDGRWKHELDEQGIQIESDEPPESGEESSEGGPEKDVGA